MREFLAISRLWRPLLWFAASAVVLASSAPASAQASPPRAAAPASGAPGAPDAASTAAGSATTRAHKLLAATIGGSMLRAHDEREASAERGGYRIRAAVLPGGAVDGLTIAAVYDHSFGDWTYLYTVPSLDGAGPAKASAYEHRHRADLNIGFDVVGRLWRTGPVHATPFLDFGYLLVDSTAYGSHFIGGGGGIDLSVDIGPMASIDGAFGAVRGFTTQGGENTIFGPVKGAWRYSAGASLGATDWSRIRLAYVGEALDRALSTRFTNGVELSLDFYFL